MLIPPLYFSILKLMRPAVSFHGHFPLQVRPRSPADWGRAATDFYSHLSIRYLFDIWMPSPVQQQRNRTKCSGQFNVLPRTGFALRQRAPRSHGGPKKRSSVDSIMARSTPFLSSLSPPQPRMPSPMPPPPALPTAAAVAAAAATAAAASDAARARERGPVLETHCGLKV